MRKYIIILYILLMASIGYADTTVVGHSALDTASDIDVYYIGNMEDTTDAYISHLNLQKSIRNVDTTLTGLLKSTAGVLSTTVDSSAYWNTAFVTKPQLSDSAAYWNTAFVPDAEFLDSLTLKSDTSHLHSYYESTANKSTDTSLGTSNLLFPTQNAVKGYVDGATAIHTYYADSLYVTAGTLDSGTVDSLSVNGSGIVGITESTGSNPIVAELKFSSVTSFTAFVDYSQYDGSTSHQLAIEAYSTLSSSWERVGIQTHDTTYSWHIYGIVNYGNYTSAGVVWIRYRHLQNGVASHKLLLDYVSLRHGGVTGGGVTDHGGLEGLQDPDHNATAIVYSTTATNPKTDVQNAITYIETTYSTTGHNHSVYSSTFSKSFSFESPVAGDDRLIWRIPYNITLTACHLLTTGSASNVTGMLEQWNSTGASLLNVIDSTDLSSSTNIESNDTSLDSALCTTGNYLYWRTQAIVGSPASGTITFEYRITQ